VFSVRGSFEEENQSRNLFQHVYGPKSSAVKPRYFSTSHCKTPTAPIHSAFKHFSCSSSQVTMLHRYLGICHGGWDASCWSIFVKLWSFSHNWSSKGLYFAGPSINSKTSMISSERSGYTDGAYCTLLFFVYNEKVQDECGNANLDIWCTHWLCKRIEV